MLFMLMNIFVLIELDEFFFINGVGIISLILFSVMVLLFRLCWDKVIVLLEGLFGIIVLLGSVVELLILFFLILWGFIVLFLKLCKVFVLFVVKFLLNGSIWLLLLMLL